MYAYIYFNILNMLTHELDFLKHNEKYEFYPYSFNKPYLFIYLSQTTIYICIFFNRATPSPF